eukprot:11169800-Lingulodinium_polyedra.AAC.1
MHAIRVTHATRVAHSLMPNNQCNQRNQRNYTQSMRSWQQYIHATNCGRRNGSQTARARAPREQLFA